MKRSMKQMMAVLMSGAMVLSLSACGGSDAETTAAATEAAAGAGTGAD